MNVLALVSVATCDVCVRRSRCLSVVWQWRAWCGWRVRLMLKGHSHPPAVEVEIQLEQSSESLHHLIIAQNLQINPFEHSGCVRATQGSGQGRVLAVGRNAGNGQGGVRAVGRNAGSGEAHSSVVARRVVHLAQPRSSSQQSQHLRHGALRATTHTRRASK
jgi:hypothetical protein